MMHRVRNLPINRRKALRWGLITVGTAAISVAVIALLSGVLETLYVMLGVSSEEMPQDDIPQDPVPPIE